MEIVRRFVRALVGSRAWLYVLAANALDLWFAISRGRVAGVRLFRMKRRPGPGVWIKLPSLAQRIHVRPATDDVGAILNNVLREEYGQLPAGFSPKVIVDAGAYIGDTTAYFLSRYPDARVIAIEPNAENFHLAVANLEPYGARVAVLQCALWGATGAVGLKGQQMACAVSDTEGEVPASNVPTPLERFDVAQVDLMKMDIEGAEVEVLRSGVGGWLRQVRCLLLETHGRNVEETVLPLLPSEGFSIQRHRNVWYCFRAS